MPELPEVETVMRGIEPVLIDQTIDHIILRRQSLRFPICEGLPDRLKGQKFVSLKRRGKYILAFAEDGYGFVLHLGMSGRVHIRDTHALEPYQKHDHVIWVMGGDQSLVFEDPRRFGFLKLIHRDTWQSDPAFCHMGPEPLSNDFSGPVLAQRLAGRKSDIKAALLDQKIVAGVGNIYACEALYDAGINPRRKAGSVQGQRAETLAYAIRDVLGRAIEAGGSSLKDYKKADGQLGYFQHRFHVYDRQGQPCPDQNCACHAKGGVKRIVQGGRSTFYCSYKQR